MSEPASPNHLSENEIAAYLSRRLTRPERDRVESHLAACPQCRREIVDVVELLKRYRPPSKLSLAHFAGITALVVVIALAVKRSRRVR